MAKKKILRDQVRDYLLGEMQKGNLEIGKTVNLAALARIIGVSVTPIREALTQLQQSRIIKAVPNRGFIVPELQFEEAKNLYDLVANMEALALEESEISDSDLIRLREQQVVFENADNALDKVNSDVEFHRLLSKNYDNAIAQEILTDLKTRIFFYEKELAKDTNMYTNSHNQHHFMIEAIADNNKPTAALILKMNWRQSLGHLQKLLTVN